jgi:hypothetical protein
MDEEKEVEVKKEEAPPPAGYQFKADGKTLDL